MTVTNLCNRDLQTLMAETPDLLLLDVRTPAEYTMLGHIPGSRLLPIHELAEQLDTLNPNQKTVVICEHGVRSHDAAHYLVYKGFTQISHLEAGMAAWDGDRDY